MVPVLLLDYTTTRSFSIGLIETELPNRARRPSVSKSSKTDTFCNTGPSQALDEAAKWESNEVVFAMTSRVEQLKPHCFYLALAII
jgi:hypothetical protein